MERAVEGTNFSLKLMATGTVEVTTTLMMVIVMTAFEGNTAFRKAGGASYEVSLDSRGISSLL